MSVQAKFKCNSIVHLAGMKQVNLSPVTADTPENKSWSQYTPSGELKLNITAPAAYNQFEVGKEYIINIDEA